MKKTVFITGATGYLGRHIVERCKEQDWTIITSNTQEHNLNDLKNLQDIPKGCLDYIFHLAVNTKAGDYCLYHSGDQWINNQILNTNMLTYWCKNQPQAKMITCGSSCSYDPTLILREDHYLSGQPEPGLLTYAVTKRMLLYGLMAIEKQWGLKWLYFIPSTLYGPNFDIEDTHFIFDLIKKIYQAKHFGKPAILWGNGEQKRELIYIDDAVRIMFNLLNENNQMFNLGTGTEYSIKEYAHTICNILDYDPRLITYDIQKYTGVTSKRLDVRKMLSHLPHFQFTHLSVGLNQAIKYYTGEVEV